MKKGIQCRVLASLTALLLTAASVPFMPAGRTASAAEKLLAFPGASGAGRYATGGRGGEVYHVTNLNDSGAGSLRDAVSKPNRIVVFDVSGTIELAGNIICSDNITVAGQTAPGGSGITLKNYKFGMGGDNIIVRYLSSRPGPDKCTSSGNDGWGGAKGSYSIIDHCSLGWTTDEQWGLYSNNEYYTVQYSVIGPANSWGGHVKGVHGFGIMMGKGYLSFDHNLIIHNVSRNFRGKTQGTETADFTNNIIYDWGYQTAYGTIGHLNYVNNTLKAGNSTTGGYHWMYVDSTTSPRNFKVYCAGSSTRTAPSIPLPMTTGQASPSRRASASQKMIFTAHRLFRPCWTVKMSRPQPPAKALPPHTIMSSALRATASARKSAPPSTGSVPRKPKTVRVSAAAPRTMTALLRSLENTISSAASPISIPLL